MSKTVTNYDGSISSTPQQLARPKSVEELQNILKQRDKYPSPVRAMGSYHSLTPCVSSPGTIVDMKAMDKIREDRRREDDVHRAGRAGDD